MSLRENLKKTLDEAELNWIEPHIKRNGVILVSSELDLLEVAVEMAENQVQKVQTYLSEGKISKPTPEDLNEWKLTPHKKFKVIIVQPFVLVQDLVPPTLH